MKIAVLGPKGTFSDRAYIEYNKNKNETLEPVYFPTIDDVFEAVAGDEVTDSICDIGIVPIENTLDGYVMRTLDLLLEKDVCIIDENMVEVKFSVVGNVKSTEEINKLYVQFKAHGQCRKFINTLKSVSICTTESNMESYNRIGDKPGVAAVVPKHIADVEREKFVIENVTDAGNNYTRFVIFKRGRCGGYDIDNAKKHLAQENGSARVRIPVYILPKTDRPGLLYDILTEFYTNKINLISIMSRPTKQGMGIYNFYIEIEGMCSRLETILNSLEKVKKENDIKILGIYSGT